MAKQTIKMRALLGCVAVLGAVALFDAIRAWHSDNIVRFICYFAVAVLSSGMKVSLPGIDGTMSVAFLFTLIGIEELTLSETLLMICSATLVQCYWRVKH